MQNYTNGAILPFHASCSVIYRYCTGNQGYVLVGMIYELGAFPSSKHRARQRQKYSCECPEHKQEPWLEGWGDVCLTQARHSREAGDTL